MTETYLITPTPGEPDQELKLSWAPGHSLIFLHRNGATESYSRSDAQQLVNGLLALLSNQFDRAVTETFLRLETARKARWQSAQSASLPQSSSPQPELDVL